MAQIVNFAVGLDRTVDRLMDHAREDEAKARRRAAVYVVDYRCRCIVYGSVEHQIIWLSYVVVPQPAKILEFR